MFRTISVLAIGMLLGQPRPCARAKSWQSTEWLATKTGRIPTESFIVLF